MSDDILEGMIRQSTGNPRDGLSLEEFLKKYRDELPDGAQYGDDKTYETVLNCFGQVQKKIEEGVEDWDGCTGKAKCCKFFTHTFNLLETAKEDEFLGAHFEDDEGEFKVQLQVQHKCNRLTDDDKCSKYDERPKTCKEYLCQASKVRRNMFLRLKYPQLAERVENEANQEEGK